MPKRSAFAGLFCSSDIEDGRLCICVDAGWDSLLHWLRVNQAFESDRVCQVG